MNIYLVVVAAFATYAKGEVITDPGAIEQLLASEDRRFVVRVSIIPQQGG